MQSIACKILFTYRCCYPGFFADCTQMPLRREIIASFLTMVWDVLFNRIMLAWKIYQWCTASRGGGFVAQTLKSFQMQKGFLMWPPVAAFSVYVWAGEPLFAPPSFAMFLMFSHTSYVDRKSDFQSQGKTNSVNYDDRNLQIKSSL